jgi:hypothetical protein
MLILKNENLSLDKDLIITDADTIIELNSDIDAIVFGLITLKDVTKSLQFVKVGNFYKGRLILTEEDLNNLQPTSLKLVLVSDIGTKHTNSVPITFNIDSINLSVKIKTSKDLIELTKTVKLLESKLNSVLSSHRLLDIKITNSDYIKPGMIPVAIDDKGNFVAQYPFADIITEVNGHTAIDGVVNIGADVIKYNQDMMLDAYIKQLAEVIKTINERVSTVSQTLASTIETLQDVRLKLETHLDNGNI